MTAADPLCWQSFSLSSILTSNTISLEETCPGQAGHTTLCENEKMKLTELGSERAIIDRIAQSLKSKEVLIGIGDDCAVVEIDKDTLHLYTTDMLVEGSHFSLDYFTPFEIGVKCMESNVSDIAAMGGSVLYGLVSVAFRRDFSVEFVDEFSRGMYEAANRYEFDIIGGDTTHSDKMVISVTLVGKTSRSCLKLRSMAELGDLIVVSGPLGGSNAGLRLFQNDIPGYADIKSYHTSPGCSMDELDKIIPIAKAMADVSDGLASDVRNICQASGVGARLIKANIPLCQGIRETAELLNDDPYEYALFGGEDYKLVYTVSSDHRDRIFGSVVGEIVEGTDVFLDCEKLTRFGFDHFARD